MRTLIIIRHSKSSWKDHSLSDFDRPLNKRGRRDAKKMSFELSEKIKKVDLLLSSSSKRTTQTSNYFLDSIDVRSNIFSENQWHHRRKSPSHKYNSPCDLEDLARFGIWGVTSR